MFSGLLFIIRKFKKIYYNTNSLIINFTNLY